MSPNHQNEPQPNWIFLSLNCLSVTAWSRRDGEPRGVVHCVCSFPVIHPAPSCLQEASPAEKSSQSLLSPILWKNPPPPPAPSKCLPHSQSLVCMFWINECVEWWPSLIAPSSKLASPDSKLLCVRGWTKPPYSFAVAASLFGLCHVPFDMISGVHWPALASLATRGYFRPTLDGSSLVMPA